MAWGGAAYDHMHDLLIIPTNRLVAEVRLIPRASFDKERSEGRNLGGGWEFAAQRGTPYGMARRFMLSPGHKLPCNRPPWGVLTAVSASTGEVKWETTVGRIPWTANAAEAAQCGLAFQAGTFDSAIYAFDVEKGTQLWRGDLPTSARSTPMTYRAPNGKQYLVVSAGGHGVPGGAPLGDYVVAFTLP
jgi:quinoprotein glucose dehydrogenase